MAEDLVKILRRYDVPVDSSAILSVLEDEEQGRLLSEWAKTHLTTDTLLTKDELSSYHAIERSGKAESLAASTDLSLAPAFTGQEINDAIEELNRSTDLVTKQTETLRQQQDALARLMTSSGKNGDARSHLEAKQLYRWESDRKALNTAVELLSQNLDYRISELEQQSRDGGGDVNNSIDEMLRSDDKLLSSLQKLGWELDTEDPEVKESVTKLRETCARLIKYTVECIRTKLDRLYLESLESSPRSATSATSEDAAKEEVVALQEELESLYSEVLPVAQMSVEQQYLEPCLRSLSSKNGQSLNRSAEAVEYIIDCLDYLLDRIGRMSNRLATFKAHENASAVLMATAKAEMSAAIPSSTARRRGTVTSMSSPARSRPQSLVMDGKMTPAPRRGTATAKSRRRSSSGALYESPLEHLLSELALSLPEQDEASLGRSGNTTLAQAAYLSTALTERTRKAADVARNVQSTFESTATRHLADARTALQLIRDSVLAESPYAEVHLVDPGIEASIGVLSQEVHRAACQLEGVERDAAALARGRNAKREEIVRRWGGRG